MNSNQELTLFYIGFKHYLGLQINMHWRDFKREWRKSRGWPDRCNQCNKKVKIKQVKDKSVDQSNMLTLDHIIPKAVIYALEIPQLLFEPSNFMLLCQPCNSNKQDKIPPTNEIPPKLLAKFYLALENRGL